MSGSTLQEGDTVTLVLSKGPMKGNIPNVVGLTLGEAGNILKENKLSLGNIKYEYSDTYNNGIVISQDPKSGSENNQEWGTVNVVVSKGQKEEVIQPPHTQDNTTSGNTGGDTSGNTGGDTSGNTGGNTSGSTGEDVSGSTGGDTSGSTGEDVSGSTGGDTSGSTGGDTSGSTGGDTSGSTSQHNNIVE